MVLHARYHQQDIDELPAYDGLVFVYPLDKTLLRGIPCLALSWDERREGRENHVAKDLDGAFLRLCLLLSQLVAAGITHRQNRGGFPLYIYAIRWLYLSADGWRMDEPTTQKQLDGRCVQHGERELYAGNTINGK